MWADMVQTCAGAPAFESRIGGCHEVLGWSGKLLNPDASLTTLAGRKTSAIYAGAEVLWYLSATGKIKMIEHYAPSYPKWADEGPDGDMEMYGAVGARLSSGYDGHPDRLMNVITLLKQGPNSRQAVLATWHPDDLGWALGKGKKNLPCYIALQFFLRNGKLDLMVTMRSNDVWLGAPYDIFAFVCLQKLVADCVGAKLGVYHHHVGSLHLYDKHFDKAIAAIAPLIFAQPSSLYAQNAMQLEHRWEREVASVIDLKKSIDWALDHEAISRTLKDGSITAEWANDMVNMSEVHLGSGLIRDSLLLCLHNNIKKFDCTNHLQSDRLRLLVKQQEARRVSN